MIDVDAVRHYAARSAKHAQQIGCWYSVMRYQRDQPLPMRGRKSVREENHDMFFQFSTRSGYTA
jgi:hypothetical protein